MTQKKRTTSGMQRRPRGGSSRRKSTKCADDTLRSLLEQRAKLNGDLHALEQRIADVENRRPRITEIVFEHKQLILVTEDGEAFTYSHNGIRHEGNIASVRIVECS